MIAAGVSNANANPSPLWRCTEERLNSLQQMRSCLACLRRMKVTRQQKNLHSLACPAEFLKCSGIGLGRGPADGQTRMRAANQCRSVRQHGGCMHFIIAALEERAEI